MPDPFIGELRCFAFGFVPQGWAACDGSLLAISQYTALFSLVGTTYGGDGSRTFGLPDLRGRAPVGTGNGGGLTPRAWGESGGQEQVALTSSQLPTHTHAVAGASSATSKSPDAAVPAFTATGATYGTTADLAMSPTMVGQTGGGTPVPTMPPFLALTWCIAVQGEFPSRP